MGAFFTAILKQITEFAAWIAGLVVAMFSAWWLLGTDVAAWIFEQVLDIVILALNSLSIDFELFDPSDYVSSLPPEMLNVISLCQLDTALGIIASACVLKILLQLIPFTRLGS